MSTPTSTAAEKTSRQSDTRRMHRWVTVIGGSLAVIGAALAAFVDPAWVVLAAIGGLSLIVFPDSKCCSR